IPATPENLGKLREFVAAIHAGGGTALGDALQAALDVGKAEGRVRTVVVLTDGLPTLGETRPEAIVKIARAGGESGLRVFPFGVGVDVDAGLLEGIAEATRGTAEIFRPGGEIETRLKRFLDRTAAPVLADLRLEAPDTFDVFPRPLPDVYLGEQMAIVGRYAGGGAHRITLSATTGTRTTTFTSVEEFRTEPGGSITVRELFARAKLDYLERQLRLRTGLADEAYFAALDRGAYSTRDEIVAEIISVSLEHQVQSAYTSFLVLLPEDRHRIDPRDEVALRRALDRVREVRSQWIDAKQAVAQRDAGGGQLAAGQGPGEESIDEPEVEEMESEDDSPTDQPYEGRQSHAAIGLGGGGVGLRRRYGGEGSVMPVHIGLEWLARRQVPEEGFWAEGSGQSATTGLALLAFLGAGHHHQAGPYKKTVSDALKYFKRIQAASGCFGEETDLCAHAVATLAMGEAYGMSGSLLLRPSCEKGLEYLVHAMATATGGDGAQAASVDPSVAVWAALAVASARLAGLEVTESTWGAARRWVESCAGPARPAGAGKAPAFVPVTNDALVAAKLFARILLGEDPTSDSLKEDWRRRMETLPRHTSEQPGRRDVGFWYFGSLAAFQAGGQDWQRFNRAMKEVVIATQQTEGSEKGSWIASGPDAAALGPIGTTALLTMCLEVYYRYGRVFGGR
ncbi:MAG: VWA domain-containing protein, partial [Planctomycetes bacterium]|nr:VWA domain-containing protein [Planctomycetota bacterium]